MGREENQRRKREMKTNQEIAYERIVEIINLVDCGKLTDSQGIKRVMKTITKQHQREYKIKGEKLK